MNHWEEWTEMIKYDQFDDTQSEWEAMEPQDDEWGLEDDYYTYINTINELE